MPMTNDEHQEIRRNPINREKYVRDKIRYKSKAKAVRIQKPYLTPGKATQVAARLEKESVVQKLSQGIEDAMIELNAKRLFKLSSHLDSDDDKISMDAVKEAGKTIERFYDRKIGKAKQTTEVKSTKINITLDMSGEAVTSGRDFIEMEADDGDDS